MIYASGFRSPCMFCFSGCVDNNVLSYFIQVCRPTSGIPNDWLRESVVVRHSRADDDFDGSGWDVESEGPRRTSTDDSHYDHGSKKSSREQQPSQIPQQMNFNNIYQVEREQHQDYHSHILDLLPTLDQFKCMLRKVCLEYIHLLQLLLRLIT